MMQLHRDGIFGVSNHVPTGFVAGLGKDRMAAGDVLLGAVGVNFVVNFVAFRRDGQQANAVDRAGGRSQLGNQDADFIPAKIDEIDQHEQDDNDNHYAAERKASVAWQSGCGRCVHP
jgi:hypothetical protein